MNINPLYPLTEDEAAELAGCLLTSSTLERYWRCLAGSSAAQRLKAEMQSAKMGGAELLKWGWSHRTRVLDVPLRTEFELPLAVLVFVLSETGVEGVEDLLRSLALAADVQILWLSGISRKALSNRSSSHIAVPYDYRARSVLTLDKLKTDSTDPPLAFRGPILRMVA